MTVRARSIQAITLARRTFPAYQVTYWSDGTARFDGTAGYRQGAWSAIIPTLWFRDAVQHARNVQSGWLPIDEPSASLVLDTVDGRVVYDAPDTAEPSAFWLLGTLVDGMCQRTDWVPLDTSGLADFPRFTQGTTVSLSLPGVRATGLALDGAVLVLAGALVSVTTSAALDLNYQHMRTTYVDDETFALNGDTFRLEQHVLFDSPSSAASVLAGSNTNGRRVWRNAAGQTWSELELD